MIRLFDHVMTYNVEEFKHCNPMGMKWPKIHLNDGKNT